MLKVLDLNSTLYIHLKNDEGEQGQLRVWHCPQVPMKPSQIFYVLVDSPIEGKKILSLLAIYDIYLVGQNIKLDFPKAQGLEILTENGWEEWEDEIGCSISELEIIGEELRYDDVW